MPQILNLWFPVAKDINIQAEKELPARVKE